MTFLNSRTILSCHAFSKGVNCTSKCKDGNWGDNCDKNCTCYNRGSCDQATGTCICRPGYQGSDCSKGNYYKKERLE